MNSDTCPRKDDLVAYALGKLGDDLIDTVSGHLESCPDCLATMRAVDDTHDSIFEVLRRTNSRPAFHEEPECRAAIAAAQAADNEWHVGLPTELADTTPLGRIRDYVLLRKIGEGGMGTVYAARHTRLQRMVAIKTLAPGRSNNEQAIGRFLREMRAVGRLEHPNIVRAIDAGEADGTYFLAFEYIEGVDLARLIRAVGPLSVADACEIIRQAADALQAVHDHGLVHRDIKPSNLMLTVDGTVKLLDLGLAVWQTEQMDDADLTATGHVLGTLEYVAPEQAMNVHDVDIRADNYGLGCTLYTLLVGHPPFQRSRYRSPLRILMAHAIAAVPPIRELRPELPATLQAVVDRMLAKQPADRFAAPAEITGALDNYAHGSDLKTFIDSAMARAALPVGEDTAPVTSRVSHYFQPDDSDGESATERPANNQSQSVSRRRPLAAVIGVIACVVAFVLWQYTWSPSEQPVNQQTRNTTEVAGDGVPNQAAARDDASSAAVTNNVVVPVHAPALPIVDVLPPPVSFEQLATRGANPSGIALPASGRVAFAGRLEMGDAGELFWLRPATADSVALVVIPTSDNFQPVLKASWDAPDGSSMSDADVGSGRGGRPFLRTGPRRSGPDDVIGVKVNSPTTNSYVPGASASHGDFIICAWQPRTDADMDADGIGVEASPINSETSRIGLIPRKPTDAIPAIDHAGDVDVFEVKRGSDSQTRISAGPHESLALLLRIFTPDGKMIAAQGPTDSNGAVVATMDVDHLFLSVSAYDGVSTGSYSIRIDAVTMH